MSLKLGLGATIVNIVCDYARQTGYTEEDKDKFWEDMDQELRIIPAREGGGDLNGHLGISREGIEKVHGGWGVGERNDRGERWKDEVQERVKTKKEAKKKADLSGQQQDKENYKQAKKRAIRAVAMAKAETLNEVYKEMETTEGEKKIFGIARARDTASKDLTQIRQIKDNYGIVRAEENEIKRRETYFERLLNKENPRTVFEDGLPNEAVTIRVTRREVEQAVKKIKHSKIAGQDNIPVEAGRVLERKA
ncbi:uncharacterized protein [Palaemon carinicauda]|uniref:uncharacterized protein n=1 Tax=Palaemon carinicauda TaxID=392227 RepID=UPI0035B5C986